MVLVPKKQVPPPVHHRKRHAMHHRRSKRYEKPYWPYLPLLAIAGFGVVINLLWTPASRQLAGHSVLGYATETSAAALLDATNAQRAGNGETALRLNGQLAAAAQAKALDMARRDYWSHITPDGAEPWQFIQNAGYTYMIAGENLAYGFDTSNGTVTGWMNSPGHRANILKADYADVGFGIAQSDNFQGKGPETIVVAMYGEPSAAPAPTPAAAPTPSTAAASPAAASTKQAAPPAAAASDTPATAAADRPETNRTVSTASAVTAPAIATVHAKPVSRLQSLSPGLSGSFVIAVTLIIAASAGIFIGRHVRYWHRLLVKGERYMLAHPALDIAIVSIITIGVLLTRTAGFIR